MISLDEPWGDAVRPAASPLRQRLDALITAFRALGVERISVTDAVIGERTECLVTIDTGNADRASEVSAELGAPPPIDRIADGHHWLMSRVEDETAALTITITGGWRRMKAA